VPAKALNSSILRILSAAIACGALINAQQVSSTLVGSVLDATGATVPNAEITVTETRTGVTRKTVTTTDGVYNLPYLTPGTYRVEITAQGFKKFVRENVELPVSSTVRVDTSLEPGALTETVTVTAEGAPLQTDRAEVARNFTNQSVTELPLANRSFQALAGLVAGVTPPTVDFTQSEDPQGTTFFRANGQGNSANNTLVDGVDNTNPTLGLTIYIPPAEVVQEVHVSTSNYNAEFGRAGGAVVNVATRGGTNEFHGALYEFHRSTDFRARDFFNTVGRPKPTYIRNQFGAAAGGPIVKNKTFFYGAYQGLYLRQSATSVTSVPDPAWIRGDFSAVPGLSLYDPATGNPDGTGRQRFANNVIPQARISPIASKLFQYIPAPNVSGAFTNNFNTNVPFLYDGNAFDGRVDHNLSDSTKIFGKMNYSRYNITQKAALSDVIGEGTLAKDYTITAIANFTHGFSPSLLTEARIGYNRYRTDVNGFDMTTVTNQSLGIANPNPDPISSIGMARIQINNMQGIGTPVFYPLINTDNLFTYVNTWSKTFSLHTVKWGAEIHRNRMDRFQPQGLGGGPRGLFQFNPGTTSASGAALGQFGAFANSFAAFLIGAPDQTSRTYMPITPTNRQTQWFFFFQDTWQISRKLTLDLGLRYELYTTVKPRYAGGASNYDPSTNTLLVCGVGEISMGCNVEPDQNNFAPRIGIAYRLNDRSVIRSGFGISYWTGRFGFTGGTTSTQFPVIYNIQQGATGDFITDGAFNTLPVVNTVDIPSNGRITPAPNQAFFIVPPSNPVPMVASYNLTYQREIGWGATFDVGYVGNLGRRLPFNQTYNAALPGTGIAGKPLVAAFGHTADASVRGYGVNSNYNSLQSNITKRLSHGVSFTLAYTWSRSLDVGSDQASFTINNDFRRNYGPSNYDRTHMLTVSHIWELPIGKGKPFLNSGPAAYILGNWQINGIYRLATGTPFSITTDATPCNCPGNGNYANVLGATSILGGIGPGQKWFDTTAFAAPPPNTFGNAGRNIVRGPRLSNYDMSIFRNFPITERTRLEFRGEFYNLTNTPHFASPSGSLTSGNFGEISSTLGGYGNREIQLALRLTF
jgi:hypothetical protein